MKARRPVGSFARGEGRADSNIDIAIYRGGNRVSHDDIAYVFERGVSCGDTEQYWCKYAWSVREKQGLTS